MCFDSDYPRPFFIVVVGGAAADCLSRSPRFLAQTDTMATVDRTVAIHVVVAAGDRSGRS
jgi:hypothetical protein